MNLTIPNVCDGPIGLADARDFDRAYPWAEIRDGKIRLDITAEQGWRYMRVVNNSAKRLPFIVVEFPAMTLPGPVDLGRVPTHFATIIRDRGACMYPSPDQPLPIWVVNGGGAKVAVQAVGYGAPSLVNARHGTASPLRLCLWVWAPVEPGAVEVFNFRVTSGDGATALFEHDGQNTMRDARPDAGPVAAVFSQHDNRLIDDLNDAGFRSGMWPGVDALSDRIVEMANRCRDLGCSRFVLWMPTGWRPVLLDPDFCPEWVTDPLARLADLCAPMRLGIGCRAGAIADPATPGGVRSRRREELPDAIRSLARAVGAGVGTFWRDEGGYHAFDREFDRVAFDLATAAGLDPLLISERPTWADLDICHAYSQVQPRDTQPGDKGWYYGPSNPTLPGFATAYNRRPDMKLIADAGHGPWYGKLHNCAGRVPEGIDEIYKHGGVMLMPAADAETQVPLIRAAMAKYGGAK